MFLSAWHIFSAEHFLGDNILLQAETLESKPDDPSASVRNNYVLLEENDKNYRALFFR